MKEIDDEKIIISGNLKKDIDKFLLNYQFKVEQTFTYDCVKDLIYAYCYVMVLDYSLLIKLHQQLKEDFAKVIEENEL